MSGQPDKTWSRESRDFSINLCAHHGRTRSGETGTCFELILWSTPTQSAFLNCGRWVVELKEGHLYFTSSYTTYSYGTVIHYTRSSSSTCRRARPIQRCEVSSVSLISSADTCKSALVVRGITVFLSVMRARDGVLTCCLVFCFSF